MSRDVNAVSTSAIADAAITKGRAVIASTTNANGVAQAGADVPILGVLEDDAAIDQAANVITLGRTRVEAGAAVAVGDPLITDANGKFVPIGVGTNRAAVALEAAAADGDFFDAYIRG